MIFSRCLFDGFFERPFRNSLSSVELIEQRLRLFQIERVEALGEPAVNWSEQFARLLYLTLVAPEAREAHCGAEFQDFACCALGRAVPPPRCGVVPTETWRDENPTRLQYRQRD
jgi:hypothetical protein